MANLMLVPSLWLIQGRVVVTIPFTRIDNGAKVVVTYEFEGAPDYPTSMILDDDEDSCGG